MKESSSRKSILLYIFISLVIGTFVFGIVILFENIDVDEFPTFDTWKSQYESKIIFRELDVECFGVEDDINGGNIWICDNGHAEYESSGVRFPTITRESDDVD